MRASTEVTRSVDEFVIQRLTRPKRLESAYDHLRRPLHGVDLEAVVIEAVDGIFVLPMATRLFEKRFERR